MKCIWMQLNTFIVDNNCSYNAFMRCDPLQCLFHFLWLKIFTEFFGFNVLAESGENIEIVPIDIKRTHHIFACFLVSIGRLQQIFHTKIRWTRNCFELRWREKKKLYIWQLNHSQLSNVFGKDKQTFVLRFDVYQTILFILCKFSMKLATMNLRTLFASFSFFSRFRMVMNLTKNIMFFIEVETCCHF